MSQSSDKRGENKKSYSYCARIIRCSQRLEIRKSKNGIPEDKDKSDIDSDKQESAELVTVAPSSSLVSIFVSPLLWLPVSSTSATLQFISIIDLIRKCH